MLVLDENLPESQRQKLRDWRVRFRTIGREIALSGTIDENLVAVLHRLPNATFFTLDRDFYRLDWRHVRYCIVWLDVADDQAADFIRRFLRQPVFNTNAKRMGSVARVHATGVQYRRIHDRTSNSIAWEVS